MIPAVTLYSLLAGGYFFVIIGVLTKFAVHATASGKCNTVEDFKRLLKKRSLKAWIAIATASVLYVGHVIAFTFYFRFHTGGIMQILLVPNPLGGFILGYFWVDGFKDATFIWNQIMSKIDPRRNGSKDNDIEKMDELNAVRHLPATSDSDKGDPVQPMSEVSPSSEDYQGVPSQDESAEEEQTPGDGEVGP